MRAQELRIGNWVKDFADNEFKIELIDFCLIDSNEIEADEYCKPIPLTEEWLIRFGFVKGNQCYPKGYSIDLLKTDFYLRPSYLGGYYWGFNKDDENLDCELNDVQPVVFVHQLQNLYFALTNTELCTSK